MSEEEVLGGFDTSVVWRSAGSRASWWTVGVKGGRTELRKERVKVLRYLGRETLEEHAKGRHAGLRLGFKVVMLLPNNWRRKKKALPLK